MAYRTMPNFASIIKGINIKVTDKFMKEKNEEFDRKLKENKKPRGRPKYVTKKDCNCEATHPCPLESKCNRNDVVYKAEISSSDLDVDKCYYIGGAKHFKQRYANHLTTFRNKNIQEECSLKDFVWILKDRGINFTIKWQILKQSRS